ncbi:MAG: hypothetical protein AAF368_00235 [Planctomycetota bacterium]
MSTVPELTVCALGTCEMSDAGGHATLAAPVPQSQRDSVSVVATYEPLLGPARTGTATVELGFRLEALSSVGAPTGSWVRVLSRGQGYLRVHGYQGTTEQFGRGASTADGLIIVGPPETEVRIGSSNLQIPTTGLLRWLPSGAELLDLVNATVTTRVDTRVQSPGQAPEEGSLTLQPGRATRLRIFDHLRELTRELPEDPTPWVLLARPNGDRDIRRLPGVRSPLPEDARFDAFRYYAFEEEVSRSPADETCLHLITSGMNSDGSYYINTRTGDMVGSSSETITPDEVRTRVSIRDGLGEVIASEFFEAAPPYPCEPTVYPLSVPITRWIEETIPRPRRR